MTKHRELFEALRHRTGMIVLPVTYDSVANYLAGFDTAKEGAVLRGFREWLQLRGARGSNLDWTGLVLLLAFPGFESGGDPLVDEAAQRHAIDTLFDLLDEFDAVVSERDGLLSIYVAFDRRRRSLDTLLFARSLAATSEGGRAVDALLRSYAGAPFPSSWFPARVREIVTPETIDDVMTSLPHMLRELVVGWVQKTYAAEPTRRRATLTPEQIEREHLMVGWVQAHGLLHWPRAPGEWSFDSIERALWWPEPTLGAMKREPARILTYMEPTIVDAVIEHLPDDIRAVVIAWARETFAPGRDLPTPRPWRARPGAEEALADYVRLT